MKTIIFFLCFLTFPVWASFDDGEKAFKQGDFEQAFSIWKAEADAGDLTAQRNIAHLYRWGKGVQQDLTQAAFWYYTSAKAGLDTAQYNLGIMYLRGEGVPRNKDEGLVWLERAKEQGNLKAKLKLENLTTGIEEETTINDNDFSVSKKSQTVFLPEKIKMKTSVNKPAPLYAHLASYNTQETLEKGWETLKVSFPELAKFKTLETHVTLPNKGKYIRLYIKGNMQNIQQVCDLLNEKHQYCLISYP